MDAFSRSLAAAALVDGQHFTLPGLGTLEGVYIPSRIDHVKRQVDPPSLKIRWSEEPDPKAQTFADLLVSTGATSNEAFIMQNSWLRALADGIEIEIGDLGTLALGDASNEVGFTPKPENLQRVYWRGGAVDMEPLHKREYLTKPTTAKELPLPAAIAPATFDADASETGQPFDTSDSDFTPKANRSNRFLRYAAMIAAVVLAVVALRFALSDDEANPESAQVLTVSNDRLNRSPVKDATLGEDTGVLSNEFKEPNYNQSYGPKDGSSYATVPGSATLFPEQPEVAKPPQRTTSANSNFDPANLAGEAPAEPSAAPNKEIRKAAPQTQASPASNRIQEGKDVEVVIILGSFGDAENAGRLTERLAGKGLLPFVDQPGAFTRVGVSFTASSNAEVDAMLARMKRDINPKAWILD